MNTLEMIGELHRPVTRVGMPGLSCLECLWGWPCPTRKLCDEALGNLIGCAACTADRDRWKADAERLAKAARYVPSWDMPFSGNQSNDWRNLRVALAAHDALTAETEGK